MNASSLPKGSEHPAARKLVGLERHYRCDTCGGEHRSWSRLRACPSCGQGLDVARIRRAALI